MMLIGRRLKDNRFRNDPALSSVISAQPPGSSRFCNNPTFVFYAFLIGSRSVTPQAQMPRRPCRRLPPAQRSPAWWLGEMRKGISGTRRPVHLSGELPGDGGMRKRISGTQRPVHVCGELPGMGGCERASQVHRGLSTYTESCQGWRDAKAHLRYTEACPRIRRAARGCKGRTVGTAARGDAMPRATDWHKEIRRQTQREW
ncbi:hypothetical protein NDU88_006082 [Pleurodeles waltl]|uniref:Uncharacterized protein n=1 Tax=Pleurodeles waltl TaxID=8319 RepID=A0AAV7L4C6_PLEWA|nr:hypothetical protein NDU88_006082 [Pleurodeles waltl]